MDRLLLLDKPAGPTSHDLVDHVRRIFHTRRVGHAGTLDPFATGLLIMGVGTATKELAKLVGLDKEYEATLHLGAVSDTFDKEGKMTELRITNDELRLEEIERVLEKFRGGYDQKAPLHSAKKVGGKKLYELARKGLADESLRPVKHVTITELLVLAYAHPLLRIRVACSSGTYIRSLADDIGRELGCGAYLEELRRTRIGPYRIEDAVTLDKLTAD